MFFLSPSSTYYSLIMIWLTIPANIIILLLPCCLFLVTSPCEFGKLYSLARLSSPSNIIWAASVKITLEKSIFLYLDQFWRFEIFVLGERRLPIIFFTDPSSQSILHILFSLTHSIPVFSKRNKRFWIALNAIQKSLFRFNSL